MISIWVISIYFAIRNNAARSSFVYFPRYTYAIIFPGCISWCGIAGSLDIPSKLLNNGKLNLVSKENYTSLHCHQQYIGVLYPLLIIAIIILFVIASLVGIKCFLMGFTFSFVQLLAKHSIFSCLLAMFLKCLFSFVPIGWPFACYMRCMYLLPNVFDSLCVSFNKHSLSLMCHIYQYFSSGLCIWGLI